MRNLISENRLRDPNLTYRGIQPGRMEGLTDAVFGIAITLLIFNLANPNSFADLVTFTKTLPAFLISIFYLLLVWREHVHFSEVFGLNDSILSALNTLFLALIIFYVYPLRFLTLFLTGLLFGFEGTVAIAWKDVPDLMTYYGLIAFALYFTLFLFYIRVLSIEKAFELSAYEKVYLRMILWKMGVLFVVPLLSVAITAAFGTAYPGMASIIGGNIYWLYSPAMYFWAKQFDRVMKAAAVESTPQK
jgi:uncharacterized membrane protein